MALPQEFEQRMERLLGEEYPAFREALARPQARGLRVSPLKIAPEAFAQRAPFTLTPVPWAEEGFFYPEEQRPGRHPYYEAGVYYIQEPSAMAVGTLAAAQPGERILDLCAAPGGKTTHLAGRMQGKGVLVANEIHAGRAAVLAQSVERMGIPNCIVLNETPERLAEKFPHFFDKIVVDAPCSGEGMFRKDDNPAQTEWTPELPAFCAERQAGILDCAAQMLRGGGKLIYSTCTFAPEEDEGSLSRFLERHPEFEMVQVENAPQQFSPAHSEWTENGNPDTAKAFRLWPHKLDGEGHFAAVLRRTDDAEGRVPEMPRKKQSKKEQEIRDAGRKLVLEQIKALPADCSMELRKDKLFLIPETCALDLSGLRVKSCGVELGTLKKNRFEPAHAVAHALPIENFYRVCTLDTADGSAEAYLRGETFPYEGEKGWTVVTADGFALGWGKAANGMMKNHYPKGLRWVGK
ncbi:MAG: RsmB/NOP family class I SAM-dependent RNA methyltransferase [Clostridia bacterium]|nr:RsmB/NOP family class I SAM-dependent RNA methyltransferase [Clostridia bacterium]